MTISCIPFQSGSYSQQNLNTMLGSIMTDGYVDGHLNELIVTAPGASMNVTVATGRAHLLNSYWYLNDAAKTLVIPDADAENPTIHRVILRLTVGSPRKIEALVLEGEPAATPAPPDLTRNASTHEISLAQVLVGTGATTIVSGNITDERDDSSVCGKVSMRFGKFSEVAISADLSLGTHKITNLGDGAASTDAVNKLQFDTETGGVVGVNKCDLIQWPGSSVPAGFLECNGQAISAGTYPDLYAIFGANLPDLRGKAVLGASTSLLTTGGEKTHTVSEAEMAQHNHGTVTSSAKYYVAGGEGYYNWGGSVGGSISDTGYTGSGGAHNNLHPYYVLRYIVRAS